MKLESQSQIPVVAQARAMSVWLALAVAVLVLAGLFAVLLVIGRMPPFDRLFADPLLFRRGLVVHVNLALVFWFYSFVAALLFMLPRRGRIGWVSRHAWMLAVGGVASMALSVAMPGALPVLSNYIPAIDHPLFAIGQLFFFAGVIASFADSRLLPRKDERRGFLDIPGAAVPALRAAGIALILAALTFFGSWLNTPFDLHAQQYYETLFWGGGHVLQLASACAMVSVWIILVSGLLGEAFISRRTSFILFALMLLPWLFAPRMPMMGTQTWHYRAGFTALMQFGIFPIVTIFLVLAIKALAMRWRAVGLGRAGLLDYRFTGFAASAALTALGFALGAMIRGSNTMVPAHYHASIGGVTVAFMAVTYHLLAPLGAAIPSARLMRMAAIQPLIFGVGQMVFAAGFALAGAHGMERKAYGVEQADRTAMESFGLAVMGGGGLVAVAGGILFLVIVISAWRARVATARNAWRKSWPMPTNRRAAPTLRATSPSPH